MNKQDYIPTVVSWAEAHGFEEIKANLPDDEDFETPISYERQADEEAFIPDVTGKVFSEKSYFEVILKTDKTRRLVSKLKLISVLAGRRGGKLYMMAPRGHYQFAKSLISENHIGAELVKLS